MKTKEFYFGWRFGRPVQLWLLVNARWTTNCAQRQFAFAFRRRLLCLELTGPLRHRCALYRVSQCLHSVTVVCNTLEEMKETRKAPPAMCLNGPVRAHSHWPHWGSVLRNGYVEQKLISHQYKASYWINYSKGNNFPIPKALRHEGVWMENR
jgi:hypothetical protein